MSEYRPPVLKSGPRAILGLVLAALTLGVLIAAGSLVLLPARIEYRIGEGKLTVVTGELFGRTRIVGLPDVRRARDIVLGRASRQLGTALRGYCVGRFRYEGLGSVWQATDCSRRGVLLELRGESRPVLLSPPDREEFLAALQRGGPLRVALPAGSKGWVAALVGGASLLVLGALFLLEALIFVGPQRMRYRIARGQVEVRTLFGRRRWTTAGMQARWHCPRVSLRLVGTAMPGYYTGLFRADGQNLRLYATRLSEGVLLEGPARVFLTPEDPDAFLSELAAAGATVTEPAPSPE